MIKGRGTRVFKGALHGPDGPNTKDLKLSNVAVVEGFNVNIISEARLLQAGVWYNGLDCTLRVGSAEKSIMLKQLERQFNLAFFEYKPFNYSSASSTTHNSLIRPNHTFLMFPTL